MNVKMAMRKAKKLGIEVKTVVANDDCASAPKTRIRKKGRWGCRWKFVMWWKVVKQSSSGRSL